MEKSSSSPAPESLEALAERLRAHVETLAGFGSRYWTSLGYAQALDYAESHLNAWGFHTRRQPFEVGIFRPILCHNLLADTNAENEGFPEVLVGAHLDSIAPGAADGGPAPGADDNASSCAILLEAARRVSPLSLASRVRFALFGAEEIGIHGSAAYVAAMQYPERRSLKAVWILDQLGLNTRPEPTLKLEGYRVRSGPLIRAAEAAAPEAGFKTEHTYRPYGSDHMPFLKAKIPTLLLIQPDDEDDPHNHTPQDTADRLDYVYMARTLTLLLRVLQQ